MLNPPRKASQQVFSHRDMDFDETSVKIVVQEFVAIVLAGFGNEYVNRA